LKGVIAATSDNGSRTVKILRALPEAEMSQEKTWPSSRRASMAAKVNTSQARPPR